MNAFAKLQDDFCKAVRQIGDVPFGLSSVRMNVYRELVFNNFEDILASCFPMIKIILGKQWEDLILNFIQKHAAASPLFHELPQEFILYLQSENPFEHTHPFLIELAHYEWVELALEIDNTPIPDYAQHGDVVKEKIILNPQLFALSYHYPVHLLNRNNQPKEAANYFYIVYRTADFNVEFIESDAFTVRLIAILQASPTSGEHALEALAQESQHPNPEQLKTAGKKILADLKTKKIILGTLEHR